MTELRENPIPETCLPSWEVAEFEFLIAQGERQDRWREAGSFRPRPSSLRDDFGDHAGIGYDCVS